MLILCSKHSINQDWSEKYFNQTRPNYFADVNISGVRQTKTAAGDERFIENSFAQARLENNVGEQINRRMLNNNCEGAAKNHNHNT